jgi:hypothetical protein
MKHPAQAFAKFILILFVFDYIFFALGNLIMTYSPDFSSASPASNWVAPPASSIPSADYTYQPDTYADASQSAEAVYVPTAPLMQAPVQDVYSPPALQPTVGTISSADSYTPSFATPSAPEAADVEEANKPMPFMGNHPTQTLLATGTGTLGGGLIGAAVKHAWPSGESDDAKSASKVQDATVKDNWTIVDPKNLHTDGTPKKIKDNNTGILYNITEAKGVTPDPQTVSTKDLTWQLGENNTLTRTVEGVTLTLKKENDKIKLTVKNSHPTFKMKEQTQQFLIDKTNHSAVQLDEKDTIIKLIANLNEPEIKNVANALQHRLGENATEVRTTLTAMGFSNDQITTFLGKRFRIFGSESVRTGSYCRRPVQLGKETCELLTELHGLNFDETMTTLNKNPTTPHTTWDALKKACDFKPATKEAAEKAAKEIKWGELVLPALAGAGIVGVGVFVADFILQRRKPNATTAEPEGA